MYPSSRLNPSRLLISSSSLASAPPVFEAEHRSSPRRCFREDFISPPPPPPLSLSLSLIRLLLSRLAKSSTSLKSLSRCSFHSLRCLSDSRSCFTPRFIMARGSFAEIRAASRSARPGEAEPHCSISCEGLDVLVRLLYHGASPGFEPGAAASPR